MYGPIVVVFRLVNIVPPPHKQLAPIIENLRSRERPLF